MCLYHCRRLWEVVALRVIAVFDLLRGKEKHREKHSIAVHRVPAHAGAGHFFSEKVLSAVFPGGKRRCVRGGGYQLVF